MTTVNRNISDIVRDAYNLGSQGNGGGALGAILATPLSNLLGPVGAIIVCIGIVIMLAVFTFGINMSEIINNLVEKTQENREERLEKKKQIKEKREQIRQEQIENIKKQQIENSKNVSELQEENVGEQIKINFGGRILGWRRNKRQKKIWS